MEDNGALQPILHVLWALAVQLPVGVLKHVISSHMNSHVLLPQAFIQSLQFLAEVPVEMARKNNMSVIYKTSNCLINSKNKSFIIPLTSS